MSRDKSYAEIVKLASHYKAIGQTDVYLSCRGDEKNLPWEYVTEVRPGGSHRLDIATSVSCRAEHPCGITFSWSIDIEDADANGRGHYVIDVPKLELVLDRLKPRARVSFRADLGTCAQAVVASAEKYEAIAGRERSSAARLALLANEKPS